MSTVVGRSRAPTWNYFRLITSAPSSFCKLCSILKYKAELSISKAPPKVRKASLSTARILSRSGLAAATAAGYSKEVAERCVR